MKTKSWVYKYKRFCCFYGDIILQLAIGFAVGWMFSTVIIVREITRIAQEVSSVPL